MVANRSLPLELGNAIAHGASWVSKRQTDSHTWWWWRKGGRITSNFRFARRGENVGFSTYFGAVSVPQSLGTTPAAARAALQQLQRARRARAEDQKHRFLPDVQVRMQVGQEQERRSTDTGGRLSTPKACPDDVHLAATSSGHCCSHWLANRAQCSPIIF